MKVTERKGRADVAIAAPGWSEKQATAPESLPLRTGTADLRFAASALYGLPAIPEARLSPQKASALRSSRLSTPSMDPRLQMAVARARRGFWHPAIASADSNEISVIAKVTDVVAWEALSEVRVGTDIGQVEGAHIVTARLPLNRVAAVRAQPFVLSLKAAHPIHPALAATLVDTGARPQDLPAGTDPQGGAGVVVGIVDFGCDFAHRNFLDADGRTRLEAIWHQAALGQSNSGFGYGHVHDAAAINAALLQPDPYSALGYGPAPDTFASQGTHGTHVMDIAAGNGRGSGVPGCAPQAALVFVDLSASDIPWSGPEAVGKSFGDSVQLLEALKFIFDVAGGRPCTINLSLGTNGGPHDGTTLVEQGIDALIRNRADRAVVIAASNSFADGIHAAGEIPAGGSADVSWTQPTDLRPAELEFWLPGDNPCAIELFAPDGTSMGLIEPGENREFTDDNQLVIFIANRVKEPNNGDQCIGLFLANAFEAGTWHARLHARGAGPTAFHAWIERDDAAQASFGAPGDNSHTLGSISCGRETIVVGSFDAHKTARPISYFSSQGPTRDGREKPEISAPGHDVAAAWSRTRTNTTRKSGTSMAAPAVTGVVALLLAEARRKGKSLSSTELRGLVFDHAKRNPPAGKGWDPRYGYGRVHTQALAAL